MKEERGEFEAEVGQMDKEKAEAEFGDVMFSLINAARLYKINPDNALERTNQKFIRRFNYLEAHTIKEGKNLMDMSLEEMDAIGLPDKAFIDINNNPDAMEFLVSNNLATDTGYRTGSGWVEHPMVHVNLPLVFQHCPESFNRINIYA